MVKIVSHTWICCYGLWRCQKSFLIAPLVKKSLPINATVLAITFTKTERPVSQYVHCAVPLLHSVMLHSSAAWALTIARLWNLFSKQIGNVLIIQHFCFGCQDINTTAPMTWPYFGTTDSSLRTRYKLQQRCVVSYKRCLQLIHRKILLTKFWSNNWLSKNIKF